MNNYAPCHDRCEAIMALVLDELEAGAADKLRKHIDTCQVCRELYEALADEEQIIRSAFDEVTATTEKTKDNIVGRLSEGLYKPVSSRSFSWLRRWNRFRITGPVAKVAAVIMIGLLFLGGVTFWPIGNGKEDKWWLGPPAAWGQEILAELENIEALVYRSQFVFVSRFRSTHVSGTWSKHYEARDRSRTDRFYEHTDEDTYSDSSVESIFQHITWEVPDGQDLLTYNVSLEFECYEIRRLEGGAYEHDPVEELRFYINLLDKADRILGTKIFDGRECVGFEINASKYGDNPAVWIDRIWFDLESKLPVRIEKHGRAITGRPGQTSTRIRDQFEYYAQIPIDVFEPEIPDGFINAEPHQIQLARIKEEKGEMIYADISPELRDEIVVALNNVVTVTYREFFGRIDGAERVSTREIYLSLHQWRKDLYFEQQLQRTEWFLVDKEDWAKTSYDFNDPNFGLIQTTLDFASRTYTVVKHGHTSHSDNPMDRIIFLAGLVDKADERLEDTEIEGLECFGFKLSAKKYGTNPDTSVHWLWFDSETKLPVKMEFEWLQDDGPRKMIKDQFEWNPKLPQDTFVPKIPAGFAFVGPDDE
jgi:outer membrane lipoprotein-sorting protein